MLDRRIILNILSEDSSSIMLAHPFSVYWLISYFIVMAPDVTIRFIRTVAMVTASKLQQSLCYCQESLQP
ncbi:hypothetical protein BN191_170040 [Clostridioides difficile T61]|nr:hypothetical protein BN169_170040 [Clostridioides difficile E16]CCL94189.1 hypothetical protein BN191_170040 [Clostridioides difficile T61]